MKRLIPAVIIIGAILLQACTPPAAPADSENNPVIVIEPDASPIPEPESEPATTTEPTTELEPETETTPEEEPGIPEVGQKAPDFKIQNSDGAIFYLSDFDKPLMLNFWNTGCRYCVVEMPILEEIYNETSEDDLVLLTINIAESLEKVTNFMEDNEIKIPVLLDTNASITRQYLVQYLPTTFFIDADGIIQDKVVGAFRSKQELEKHLDKIMP